MTDKAAERIFQENESVVNFLKTSRLFGHFPEEFLLQLAPLCELEDYPQGARILSEGQINKKVFFLIMGVVNIYGKGELLATLYRTGDIFGEMSVISSKPVSAEVVAETPVEVFSVRAQDIGKYTDIDAEVVQHILYRIFALILTEKLELTNQKAMQFETTNRQLEEAQTALQKINEELEAKVEQRTADLTKRKLELKQQNLELLASHRKLEDLISTKEQLLKQLETIHETHLRQLDETLGTLHDHDDMKVQTSVRQAERIVHHIQELLKPIKSLHFSEQAIHSKRVLLAENNKKQQIIAKMALGGTGVKLDIVDELEQGRERLAQQQYDIICTNEELIELTPIARELQPDIRSVFITSESAPAYLPKLRQYSFLSNIVTRSEEDRSFTLKNILTTVSKLVSGDFFGLEKYISWGVEVQELAIENSQTRHQSVEEMADYFRKLGVRRPMLEKCEMVAEELLMNAIYDAPVDAKGKSLYNHLPRTTTVVLKSQEQGRFRYASDGLLLAISVEDPFGVFDRKTILNYLESCYSGEKGQHHNDAGTSSDRKAGAGRGLFQIMETADLVVFNVKVNVRTEVIALFNIDPDVPKVSQATSFHYFYA